MSADALHTLAHAMNQEQDFSQELHSRMAQVLEDSVLEIYVSDASTYQFISVNRAARTNLGYNEEEVDQLMPWDFVEGMSVNSIEELIEPLRTGRVPKLVFETAHIRKDGSTYPVETHLQYMEQHAKPVFTATVQDLSGKAQRKMDSIKHLPAIMAHDFNNLMSIIIGNLSSLTTATKEEADCIDQTSRAAKMGARLTRRLSALSNANTLEPEVVDTNEQVRNTVTLLQSIIGDGIEVSLQLATDLWSVRVDRSELENTIINLAINARDAMPYGGNICIKTENFTFGQDVVKGLELSPGNYILISISDSGCGMAEEVKAHVLEPFYTTKEAGEGSGLGLASTNRFAKQSGGCVRVFSCVEQGTVIQLYLPKHAEVFSTKSEALPAQVQAANCQGRILVVEDNAPLREFAVAHLKLLGYEVSQASSGPEAIALLEKNGDFDLVFTDVMMNGEPSGVSVAQWVGNHLSNCQVLLTSGCHDTITGDSINGISDLKLLEKPYGLSQLERTIEQAMQRSKECPT